MMSLDLLVGEVRERAAAREPGVVDQDVARSERLVHDRGERRELLAVRHVATDRERGAARPFDPVGQRVEPILAAGGEHDLRSALRERDGGRLADPGRCAGHDHDRPLQFHACSSTLGCMDVIEAHARRLPASTTRCTPRPYPRERTRPRARGGWRGRRRHASARQRPRQRPAAAGGRPRQAVRSDGPAGRVGLQDVLDLVSAGCRRADRSDATSSATSHIAPEPILAACEALGDRLALAAEGGERVLIATGHPVGLDLLYRELERLLARARRPGDQAGRRRLVARSAPGPRLVDRLLSGVGMLTDGREPRHTHWPDAMQRMLADERPDLVIADHGFAGAAIEAGIETVSVADVNDPALLVAKAQGRTEMVVVMDDHVDADAYWPCFQAVAAAFPQVSA